jgi:topoisomerase-4 subunit A
MKIIGDHPDSKFVLLSDAQNPAFEIEFGGNQKNKEKLTVNALEFIAEKGHQARGKRLTHFTVKKITEIFKEIPETDSDSTAKSNDPEFEVTKTDDNGNQIILDI